MTSMDIVYELTNGQNGVYSRHRVSLHTSLDGAVAAAEEVFKSYEEFRDDPSTEDMFPSIVWNGYIGKYTDSSFFLIRGVEVYP